MRKNAWVALFSVLVPIVCLAASQRSKIAVSGAYVGEVPPDANTAAAYMVLKNPTDQTMSLVRASSSQADAVEIHKSVHQDGSMMMEQVQSVEIPAHGNAELKPMVLHLMLIGLKKSFRQAKRIDLKLFFSDGSLLKLQAPVKPE